MTKYILEKINCRTIIIYSFYFFATCHNVELMTCMIVLIVSVVLPLIYADLIKKYYNKNTVL